MNRIIGVLVLLTVLTGCKGDPDQEFVTVEDGRFMRGDDPYYYIGANYWYGAIIASKGEYGDRERLIRELDHLKSIGVNNLRVLAGAEGPDGEPFRVTPTLILAPGKYSDDQLDGLDFLLAEMKKRGQYAILYLTNSWDWSGGYSQYLNWNGYGPIPYPSVQPNTWQQFMAYAGQFHGCEKCMQQYADHVRFMLGRTNAYTGINYTEDPTVMTWEIGNEPRAFSNENIPAFEKWIGEVAALIKSIDSNHLVTTGTEGKHGCEQQMDVFERIHADPNIDYLTMHIWPKNWGWLDIKDIGSTIDVSIEKTNLYMQEHIEIAEKLNKPLVLEEFGLPRDRHGYLPDESTVYRDRYYGNAFDQVVDFAGKRGVLAGANIWTWSGEGRPVKDQTYWKLGDNYLGDPPVEEQGLNSVFDTDSTVKLIESFNKKLNEILK